MLNGRIIFLVAATTIVAYVLWPVSTPDGIPTRSAVCRNNLRQIATALYSYHDRYGSFPPAHTVDANGQPLHSWRVMILPFSDYDSLHAAYRFSESWDSPYHRELGRNMPELFRCPSFYAMTADGPASGTQNNTKTTYVVVQAENAVFNADTVSDLASIEDGDQQTILLAEVHRTAVHWLNPVDPSVDEILADLNAPRSHHAEGLHLVFADGTVKTITRMLTQQEFMSLLTKNGRDEIPGL